MATTIHLSPPLLSAVDQRARDLRVSRNRYISDALRRCVGEETAWSPDLMEELRAAGRDPEEQRILTEMLVAIRASRRSKGPPSIR